MTRLTLLTLLVVTLPLGVPAPAAASPPSPDFAGIMENASPAALSAFAAAIGVAAVITMVALGTGAQTSIEAQIQSTGTNMIIVSAGNFSQGGVRQGQGNASTLTPDDAASISRVDGVQYTAAGVNTRGQLIYGNQNWYTSYRGVTPEYFDIKRWLPDQGALFSEDDVEHSAEVCVLGRTGLNFGAGFTGGFAYVLDLDRDFVDRYNHELVDIHRISMEGMEQNLHHLRGLIEAHARETDSRWAEDILNDLRTFIGKFWLVKPKAAAIDTLIENLRRAA